MEYINIIKGNVSSYHQKKEGDMFLHFVKAY